MQINNPYIIADGNSYTSVSRAFDTDYTNSSGKTIKVIATFRIEQDDGDADGNVDVLVNGVAIANTRNLFNVAGILGVTGDSAPDIPVSFFVTPNSTYRFNATAGGGVESIISVFELSL